jgi:type IV pilus assembly protein PilB
MIATAPEVRQRLGTLLAERGYLTADQLDEALGLQHQDGGSQLLGEILLERSYCTEDQLTECLALQYGVPHAKLDARLLDAKTPEVVPREFLEQHPHSAGRSEQPALALLIGRQGDLG